MKLLGCLLGCTLLLAAGQKNERGVWKRLADAPFVVSQGAAVAVGKKVYLIGGLNSTGAPQNVVASYDTATDKWNTSIAQLPEARFGHQLVARDNFIYVFGGDATSTRYPQEVFAYDIDKDTWNPAFAEAPRSRAGHVAATVGNNTYLIGGRGNRDAVLGQVDVYNWGNASWSVRALFPVPRYFAAATVIVDQIFVIGGTDVNGVVVDRVDAFDTAKDEWHPQGTHLEVNRTGAAALTLEAARVFVFGGTNANGQAEEAVELYDLMRQQWGPGGLMQRPWRFHMAATSDGNRAFLIAGNDTSTAVAEHWMFYEESAPTPNYPTAPPPKGMPAGAVFAIIVVCVVPVVTLFFIFRKRCSRNRGEPLVSA